MKKKVFLFSNKRCNLTKKTIKLIFISKPDHLLYFLSNSIDLFLLFLQTFTTSMFQFCDDYEHISDTIEYILENQLQPNDGTMSFTDLETKYNSTFPPHCTCKNSSDTSCSRNNHCFYGGNYVQQETELCLNSERICKDLLYECFDLCDCSESCINRLVQLGPRKRLVVKDFSHLHKQHGLICEDPVPQGGFICEYTGELLTKEEAERRNKYNEVNDIMNYILCVNEKSLENPDGNGEQFFIDPSQKGNIGRYLNHSCLPNCELISVRVGSYIPKIGIFAKQFIVAGEELCFDYGGGEQVKVKEGVEHTQRKLCFCRSSGCRKYLPNIDY
jgi:[histone H3]-lysine36 N-dimethyltransferase SETMAR